MTDNKTLAARLRTKREIARIDPEDPERVTILDEPDPDCLEAADALDRLTAPEGVGLTRYSFEPSISQMDPLEPLVAEHQDPTGEWVRHDDAAAALAAKDAEIAALKELADTADAKLLKSVEVNLLAIRERNAAEAQVATLKEALADRLSYDDICSLSRMYNQVAWLCDPDDLRINEWLKREIARAALSTLPAPAARSQEKPT